MNEAQMPSSITVSPDDPASMAKAIALIAERFGARLADLERSVRHMQTTHAVIAELDKNPAIHEGGRYVSYAQMYALVGERIKAMMDAGGAEDLSSIVAELAVHLTVH